jgi:hypothetical protein
LKLEQLFFMKSVVVFAWGFRPTGCTSNETYHSKYWPICKIYTNIIFTYFWLQNNIWMWIGFKKVEGYLNFWSWSNCCLWNQFWKVFVVLKTQDAWPMSNMLSHIGHEDINLKNTILTYGKLNIWIGFK